MYLAGAGCDHVDDLLQGILIVSGQLPFINAQREIAVKGGGSFEADLGGVEVHHQALRVTPCGECCFQGGGLTALGAAPVVNKEYSLLHDPQERGGEAGRKDEPELVPCSVRLHVFDPLLHASALAVCRRHAFLRWVDVEADALVMSWDEPLSRLPPEGGGSICLGDDVDVLGLQGSEEPHHLLGVLRGNGAAEVCECCYGSAGEDRGAGVGCGDPLAVPLEGDLHLLIAGFDGLQALRQDDGGSAYAGGRVLLLIDHADALVRINPSLRLSEVDGCAGDCLRDLFFVQVDGLCSTQGLPDHLGRFFLSVLQVNIGRVFRGFLAVLCFADPAA